MALVDEEGRFISVNRIFCQMLGYSEEELLALTRLDITHPEDTEKGHQFYERLFAREIDDYHYEKRFLHKDGHVV